MIRSATPNSKSIPKRISQKLAGVPALATAEAVALPFSLEVVA
jgi:hypothetical protein